MSSNPTTSSDKAKTTSSDKVGVHTRDTNTSVRFAPRNNFCYIEKRGHSPQQVIKSKKTKKVEKCEMVHQKTIHDSLDDEVSGHPSLKVKQPQSLLKKDSIDIEKFKENVKQQLKANPSTTTIVNPITQRKIKRFRNNYWDLLKQIAGEKSTLYVKEKSNERKM